MKRNHKQMWRSVIALVLTFTLVFGTASTAFATNSGVVSTQTPEDQPLVYVSIGDSMTNGYGLDGYDGESGIMNYGVNTYANHFAAWLAGYEGDIEDDQFFFEGTNGAVDHRQLAMSGMRAEDLHWLLELDYKSNAPYQAVNSYIHRDDAGKGPSWGDKHALITDKPEYKKWFEWYTPKTEGGFGFTAGDYRTYADLVDPSYRLGDGVAKMMSLYGYNSDKYFNSDYDTEAMVNAAITGLEKDKYYPEEDTDKNGVVMGYSEADKTALWMQIAGEFYQESVEDADIITLALGNTNFGTFLFQYIRWSIENDAYEFDNRYNIEDAYKLLADFNPNLETAVRALMDNEVNDIIDQFFSVEAVGERCATEINYIIKYCVLSYLVNYIGAVERIVELNPDVTLIQLALMNAYATADPNQQIEGTSFAELIDMIYDPVNAFIAALPVYMQANNNPLYEDATFIYADAGLVETLSETFGDNFYKVDGKIIDYPGLELTDDIEDADSLIRERFRHWIAGDYGEEKSKVYYSSKPSYGEIWKGLLHNYVDTSKEGDFFGTYDLMYVTDGDLAKYVEMSNADFEAKITGDDKKERDWAFSILMYLAFEHALIEAGQGSLVVESLGKLSGIGIAQFENAINEFCEKLGVEDMTSAPAGGIGTIDIMKLPEYLSETLLNDSTAASLLALCSRMQIGTGIGGHPSEGGHDTMYKAIKKAYEEGYTAQDEVKSILLEYFKTTYPSLWETISSSQGAVGNIDDLAIIVAMMKMSGNAALEGVDLDELEAQIRELNKYVDTELAPEDQAFVLELSNDVMDRTQNLASKATYTKYEPTEDSYYVSLGDSNVNGYGLPGYEEGTDYGLGQIVEGAAPVELAQKLYGEGWEDRFAQYAQGALRSEDMLYILGVEDGIVPDSYYETEVEPHLLKGNIEDTRAAYIEALEKADLISLAVGGGNVTTFVGRQVDLAVTGKDPVEMDWSKIGVEDNATMKELNELLDVMVPIVDEIGLLDKYLPEGMDNIKNPAKFARVLAESLLYGYASYNYYYPQVLDRIKDINPDAQLMILGMFNPVDDWTLETEIEGEDVVVPIGGVVNNLMEAANIQNLAYALQTENTTYVDLSDNITFLDEKIADGFEPTFADYYEEILQGNGKEVHASAAGHEYMTEQMYKALQEEYLDNYGKAAFEFLWPLIEKYYDEAYAYAYEYADKEGYIDMTIEGIDEVVKALDEIQAEAEKTGMSAELKAELAKAIAGAKETAEQLKVLIKEADVLDEATLDEAIKLVNKLEQNLNDVIDLAEQAGIDTVKQLRKAYEYLKPIVIEKLKEAVATGTEWLVAKIKEALPKVDKALYDWFYNNPEDVINFFVEYSDEIKAITDKYGDEALAVLGYVLYTYGPEAVEWALENPEEAIEKWVQWYNKHGHKVWPMIDKYIKTMDEMGMFDDVKQALNDAYAEVEAMIIAYAEKVVAELEAMLEELDAAARAALEDLKEAIEAAKEDAEAGIADILAALEDLYEQGVIAYEGATSGYYAATEDSYYVALGDTDVEYAEIVADELDLEDEQFVNYGIEDMTAAELRGYLEAGDEDLTAEVEKADLITLGFSNNTITKFAADKLAAVMAGETVDMDWAPYVGKDGAAAMDKAVAAIEEALVAEGADAATIDMIATVVEAYAFACTEFACNYPEAINAIKAINPEAQVVVVGMYNPFDGAVLDIEGTQVPVGEFVNVLVELANVHYLSYALLTGNAVYVHAPAVETKAPFEEAMGIEGFASVLTDLDSLEPSAAGHEYIAQQILDAMNVVSKAVYDAQKLIDEIAAFGDVTRENLEDAKALAEAARQAWDKLTDEEKELIGLENYKVLVDFELAVAKVELGIAEDIAAAEKALAEAEAKAAEIERALKITESTVTDLKAKVVNKSQIKVTWKAPETTPDQYRVALIRDGKKVSTTYISGEKTTVTLKNLLRGTNFTVRVTPVAKVDGQKYFSIYKTSNKVKTQLQKANLTVKKAGLKKQIMSKDQNSTGFQIYISKDKNFKKDVKKLVYKTNKKGLNVKVKAKNFKKGTNYVKVRAYTKVNGKTVYGAWSGTVKGVK